MIENQEKKQLKKKTYIKPKVTQVRLVAGEAVLALCKDGVGGLTVCYSKHDLTCDNSVPHS